MPRVLRHKRKQRPCKRRRKCRTKRLIDMTGNGSAVVRRPDVVNGTADCSHWQYTRCDSEDCEDEPPGYDEDY